ncbi:MAG TPA: TVP38/TMEM64 family protein [Sphingomicrobium sp.]|nr:TVP38/TMEM64 family protein [Sphingomicrobium sp.]
MDRRSIGAIVFAALVVGVIGAFLLTPVGDWLSLERLKDSRVWLTQMVAARPLLCTAGFFLLCVAATAVCFPAAPVLGLSGGALFGFWPGLLLVLLATSIGSTIAFFESRYSLRDWVKRRFARRMEAIDRGVQANGGLYLLTLRLNPVVPYWLVNLAMGLTAMRPSTYVPLTLAGLAPATLIYVTAGTQLASIDRTADILSVSLLATLLLLSLFPLIVKLIVLAFTAPLPDLGRN